MFSSRIDYPPWSSIAQKSRFNRAFSEVLRYGNRIAIANQYARCRASRGGRKRYVFATVDRPSRFVFAQLGEAPRSGRGRRFLASAARTVWSTIHKVRTETTYNRQIRPPARRPTARPRRRATR